MHETVGTTQRFGQANRQLTKAGQTHTAAESDDRGLARRACRGHLRNRRFRGLPRVREHPFGNLLFGPAQAAQGPIDVSQHVAILQDFCSLVHNFRGFCNHHRSKISSSGESDGQFRTCRRIRPRDIRGHRRSCVAQASPGALPPCARWSDHGRQSHHRGQPRRPRSQHLSCTGRGGVAHAPAR